MLLRMLDCNRIKNLLKTIWGRFDDAIDDGIAVDHNDIGGDGMLLGECPNDAGTLSPQSKSNVGIIQCDVYEIMQMGDVN